MELETRPFDADPTEVDPLVALRAAVGHATRTQAMPVLNKIRHELRPYVVDAERTA